MKMMIDRARDLFLENPNQTAEEVALILSDEYNEVAAHHGVRPSALYAQCLECACLVLQVREHLEKLAKEKPSRVQERVQELLKKGPDAEGEYVELIKTEKPNIEPEELKELILQFRDAVSDQQSDPSALPN